VRLDEPDYVKDFIVETEGLNSGVGVIDQWDKREC